MCLLADKLLQTDFFFPLTDIFMLMLHKLIIIHSHEFLPHLRLIKTPFLFVFFFNRENCDVSQHMRGVGVCRERQVRDKRSFTRCH